MEYFVISVALYWVESEKLGPGVPSAFTIPFDNRFAIDSPFFGAYVPKTWSKVRFSPRIMITCCMGDVAFGLGLCASAVKGAMGLSTVERSAAAKPACFAPACKKVRNCIESSGLEILSSQCVAYVSSVKAE